MKRALPAVLVSLLAVTCAASTVEFGPHAGYLFGDDLGKSPQAFGLHLDLNAPLILTLQGFATRVGTRFEDLNIPDPATGRPLGTTYVDGWVMGGSLILRTPPILYVTFFLGGGMDYSVYSADVPDKVEFDVDPATGYHALAGVSLALGRRLLIIAEYRHFFGARLSGSWESTVGGPGEGEDEDEAPPAVVFSGGAPSRALQFGVATLGVSFGM